MKRYIILALVLVFIISSFSIGNLVVAKDSKDTYVKIMLKNQSNVKQVKLDSSTGFSIYEIDNNGKVSKKQELTGKSIIVKLEGNGSISLYDNNDKKLMTLKTNQLITSNGNGEKLIKVEDKEYRDYITFAKNGDKLITINYIELEHYLYGVVAREVPASFHIEARKAQAVAARTYAIRNINYNRHKDVGADLCDDTHCQVYGGKAAENDKINEAIDATKGLIITYNGKPIDAVYHSNSGGHTDNAHEIWGGSKTDYLVAVKDDYSINQTGYSWEKTFSAEHIGSKLKAEGHDVGNVIDIQVVSRTEGGRAKQVKIIGSKGEKTITGEQFRKALGYTEIRSTLFTITKNGQNNNKTDVYVIGKDGSSRNANLNDTYVIDKSGKISKIEDNVNVITKDGIINLNDNVTPKNLSFTFQGKGYGHGIGMSQYGANAMAKNGIKYENILKFYYKGVKIEPYEAK